MEIGIHKGVFKYTKLKPTKGCGKSSLLTLEFFFMKTFGSWKFWLVTEADTEIKREAQRFSPGVLIGELCDLCDSILSAWNLM